MMARLGELWRRMWYLLNRARFERELREEMDTHRAMAGMSDAAGPRFGNQLRLREEAADQWGWAWFERLEQDVRFGMRLLRRSPVFTLTAVLVLALGIGINLAAFQVFDAAVLSPLPVRSPGTLVWLSSRTTNSLATSFCYPEYAFYRSRASLLAGAFALASGSVEVNAISPVNAEFVSVNYLTDLGARPTAGRLFDSGDEAPGAEPVVLLGEAFWRARFGADPGLVGRRVQINGHPFMVAGIVPSTFTAFHNDATGVWIPIAQHGAAFTGSTLLTDWSAGSVRVYARLRDGVSQSAAQAELGALAAALHRERPAETQDGAWIDVRPAGTYMALDADRAAAAIALVGALVLLVLVAACMNLGILILTRTLAREREFALRLSVGASRRRILRQLLTEHTMLGLIGAAVGCGVAAITTRALAAVTAMPPGLAPHLTGRSSVVAAALALISSIAFGFTPALQAIRPAVARRLRLGGVLVASQIAAAAVLLIVSGLLVRGVARVVRMPLGFDYGQTLQVDPDLAAHGVKAQAATGYWQRVEARLRQAPGVANTGLTTLPPFGNRISADGRGTVFYKVTSSYFDTMRIPLLRGRLFRDAERGVVIVSEALARRRWPGVDPLGQAYGDATVVGVAGNARTVRIGDESASECYRAIEPADLPAAVVVVRAERPRDVAAAAMAIVKGEGAGLTPQARLLADAFDDRLGGPRRVALIASTLGVTALLLAVVGLGGLVAYSVSQRTREIGVRLALGARPMHLAAALARQFWMPTVGGAAAGSLLAAGVGTVLSRELFGVSQFDPLAHGGALLFFAVVAVSAAAPSFRRALRVDPATTLRAE
jgi:predicted permease